MSLETVDPAIWTLVYRCAVDANSEGWSKQTEKCPIEPVIDKVAALVWKFETREIWHNRFVGHGRIIKRERARKESIAGNSMGVRGMDSSKHGHYDQQTPWQHDDNPELRFAVDHPHRLTVAMATTCSSTTT